MFTEYFNLCPWRANTENLKTYLAIEMSPKNAQTHDKLQRRQTMQITAEIVQTYNLQNVTAQLYLKFLLITHHEDPFIDASEATKRARDRTENGKCTNVTNRRSRVRLVKPILHTISHFPFFAPFSSMSSSIPFYVAATPMLPTGVLSLSLTALFYFFARRFSRCAPTRGGGEHSATPGTFFVFGSSTKK